MTKLEQERGVPERLPALRLWLGGALAWGLAMAASLMLSLHLFGRANGSHDLELTVLYASGGLIGWLMALPVIRLTSQHRPSQTVFAAWLLILGLATIGATAGLFALQYRVFYAHWHAPFPSRIWVYQQIFTTASALYQFAVLGIRHFLPAAFVALLVISLSMARRNR